MSELKDEITQLAQQKIMDKLHEQALNEDAGREATKRWKERQEFMKRMRNEWETIQEEKRLEREEDERETVTGYLKRISNEDEVTVYMPHSRLLEVGAIYPLRDEYDRELGSCKILSIEGNLVSYKIWRDYD